MSSTRSVPFLDLRRHGAVLDAELTEAFRRVLESGRYILGPEVEAFEDEIAQYLSVKHAIGVSSGTDALLLALMALGVGPGDEVICPTYTFFATAGAIVRVGATPVFVDIQPCCFTWNTEQVLAKATARTKAVIPVHLFGQCAEMDPVLGWARRQGVYVVEDAAQAMGAELDGRKAGTMGDFGCFSFFPSKNLGALGDAGLLVTNDDALARRARVMRVHGAEPKFDHGVVGGNFRLDELQAAFLGVKLRYLEGWIAARQRAAAGYTSLLRDAGLASIAPKTCRGRHVFTQYAVRVPPNARGRVQSTLREHGVETSIYYPSPLHVQGALSTFGGRVGDHPVSEQASMELLALPLFPELERDEQAYVVRQLAACLS